MDMDKIISDLVEKRFENELCYAVRDVIEGDSYHPDDSMRGILRNHIRKIMQSIIDEKSCLIKKLLEQTIDKCFLEVPIASLDYRININMSSFEVQSILNRIKKEEEK